ncbi:hypothetical protein KEM56_005710, partial [Ascosphaera pollenicola]
MPSSPIRLNILGEEEDEDEDDDKDDGGAAEEGPASPILITPNKRRRIEMEFPPSSPPSMSTAMAMSSSPLKRFDSHFSATYKRDEEGEDEDEDEDENIMFNVAPPIISATKKHPRLTKLHESITVTPTSLPTPSHSRPATNKPVASQGQGIRRSKALQNPGQSQLFVRAVSGTRQDRFALAYPGYGS